MLRWKILNCLHRSALAHAESWACRRLPVTTIGVGGKLEESREIEFPEPVYSAGAHANPEFETENFRYSYQSLVSPASVYEYELKTGNSTLLKQQEVPGGFDSTLYGSERVWVEASDGVKVPVSVVYRRDFFKRDSKNPLYLYGYGSYGYPLPIGFSPSRLSLLDRGVVIAYAHIRGGGEMGDSWHDAGKMMVKRTTFSDFIAAAEQLVEKGYGAKDRVAIEGGSAGGLLMGAVVNAAAGSVQRGAVARAVRGCDEYHAGRLPSPYRRGV